MFHVTAHSFAIVNLKPLLPGHVLVCPRRRVVRYGELSSSEISDLFQTVQRVGQVVERVFGGSSLNIAIQDGTAAGQSVPHLHAHIIPRKAEDLSQRGGTDAIYDMLEGDEGNIGRQLQDVARPKFPPIDESGRKPRSESEMAAEARMLAAAMNCHEQQS